MPEYNTSADLIAILNEIKGRLDKLERVNPLQNATLPEEGTITIDGILSVVGLLALKGDFELRSADDDLLVVLGDMPLGDRGYQFKRSNGSVVYEVRQMGAGLEQVITMYDVYGNVILAEMSFLGGLANPYLAHPFQPIAAASGTAVLCGPYGFERTTSSTTFETLFVHDGKRQNPWVDIKVMAKCSDNTTAGEVQLVDLATGNQLPSFFGGNWLGSIPASTPAAPSWVTLDPSGHQNGIYNLTVNEPMRLGLQVRRTAGAGTITVSIPQAIGG